MKIPVILNGKKIILEADPEEKLLETLRKLNLHSVKCGCGKGLCGSCTILLNGKCVPACLIPSGIVKDSEIITLEYFLETKDGQDIEKGFSQAGIKFCGYCNSGRYFKAYEVINRTTRPEINELEEVALTIDCSCTDSRSFINGILYAIALKHEREGRKNGNK